MQPFNLISCEDDDIIALLLDMLSVKVHVIDKQKLNN